MKLRLTYCLPFILLLTAFAAAQVPCNPTALPKATLFVSWPQFRYDAQHTGCNPYETVLSTATVGGLVVDWTYPTAGSVYGDPVVANGLVYFSSVSPDNTLYAVNASTGTLVWKQVGQATFTSPLVVNGVVYAGLANDPGGVYAFNASTGDLLWQYTTVSIVESAPAIANGVLYVGDGRGYLYAINASTGTLLWSYAVPSDEIDTSPAVANGVIYFVAVNPIYPDWSTTLYALNASTHQVIWQYQWPYAIGGLPVVASGKVFVNSTAFNANTGALLYVAPVTFFSIPALSNGVVYVGSDDNNVYALNANTGAIKWSFRTGDFVASSPAIANGVVYVESDDGNFYALNASTGAPLWQYTVSNYAASGPAVANGLVYIGSEDNTLYTFHLPGH